MAELQPSRARSDGPQHVAFPYFHFNETVHKYEKPYEILINLPSTEHDSSTQLRHNQEFHDCTTIVEDARGRENGFTLNNNGVCWRKWKGPIEWQGLGANEVKLLGHDFIQSKYVDAVEEFIKTELESQDGKPVDRVKVFDYKLRASSDLKEYQKRTLNLEDGLDPIIPATHPHVDQSFDGANIRVNVHMGDEASALLKRRFRIINIWKPLRQVVNWPLGICDSSTVHLDDLVAADYVRRKYVGETFYSTYNPNHKWYYLSNQMPDEVTMLKIHDSNENAEVRFSLHAAFQLNGHGVDDSRESFEVRALVFDPPE